ncbi:MAG: sensor histidine kinase [Chitinophagales bacterium]|nr:sensor histidine kinase [Chitinophagales bacterium]
MDNLNKYRILYHIGFWVLFILVFSVYFTFQFSFLESLKIFSLTALTYIPAVYFNVLYLIPNILIKKRNFARYFLFLFLTVLVSVPLVALATYLNFHGNVNFDNEQFKSENGYLWLVIGSFINTFFIVILVSGLKFAKDYFIQLQKTMDLEKQNLQSELKYLKSQVNPHFLFNTLNNIYSLTLKKDELAPDAVLKLSSLLRYMLYECNEKKVSLAKEIQCLENYIDLEKIRQCSNSRVDFIVKGNPDNFQIAPLLFIPFLENSFKHGLNTKIAGWVEIFLEIKDDKITFIVENCKSNVCKTDRKAGGIGLQNIRRRLALSYPGMHDLKITDSEESYKVVMMLDLSKNVEQEKEPDVLDVKFKKPQLKLLYGNKMSDS